MTTALGDRYGPVWSFEPAGELLGHRHSRRFIGEQAPAQGVALQCSSPHVDQEAIHSSCSLSHVLLVSLVLLAVFFRQVIQ